MHINYVEENHPKVSTLKFQSVNLALWNCTLEEIALLDLILKKLFCLEIQEILRLKESTVTLQINKLIFLQKPLIFMRRFDIMQNNSNDEKE